MERERLPRLYQDNIPSHLEDVQRQEEWEERIEAPIVRGVLGEIFLNPLVEAKVKPVRETQRGIPSAWPWIALLAAEGAGVYALHDSDHNFLARLMIPVIIGTVNLAFKDVTGER